MAPQPSTWRGRSEQTSLDQVGCEARKIPAVGEVFFLDFSLYRTNQALAAAKADKFMAVARSDGHTNGSLVLEPSDVKGGPAGERSAETIHREANQD